MSDSADAPLVSLVSGKAVASSVDVAVRFEKRHYNVLRTIEKHLQELSEVRVVALKIEGNYFIKSTYTDAFNKKRPMYHLTRDGFALLVMSFTGKVALAWKMRYIEAFNAMEAELLRKEKGYAAYRAERIYRAGELQGMLNREPDRRKNLIKRVLTHAEARYSHKKIAENIGVSRYAVGRILRRYAPYAEDYFFLDMIGKEHDVAHQEHLMEMGRQMVAERAAKRSSRESGLEA
jgi:Rha family phage regulatory protein